MRHYTLLTILIILGYAILTPAFICGRGPVHECTRYVQDTVPLALNVANLPSFHVHDTIKFNSLVSDTIHSTQGRSFISELQTVTLSLQGYKVVNTGSGYSLNYANIEFNPIVTEGQLLNAQLPGITYLFNRNKPLNKLQGAVVAGSSGLYIFVVNNSGYYGSLSYIVEPQNNCASYTGIFSIPESQQQNQQWDGLGTSVLRIGSSSAIVATKNAKDYFFVNILP